MKVLLINPNFRRKVGKTERISQVLPPMGLAYLAAVLKREEISVKILDLNALDLNKKQFLDYLQDYKPDIVGLGAVTITINKVWNLSKIIKEKFNDIKIVLGGPHPTSLPEESIEKDFVDFVVVGEGELTLLELIKELNKKGKKNFTKIHGLVFKIGGRIFKNRSRKSIENFDSLPFPALEFLPLEKYRSADGKSKKFITILTSRGCPGRCNYCNKLTFGYNCRMRSYKNITREIELLKKNYGYKDFHILDDLFTNDRKRVVNFCKTLLKKKLKIVWRCGNGVRAGTVDLELLKLMKKAGCYFISYGAESGNQKILNNIKKGQTLKQVENAIKWTKKAGINCGACFMFGNLGENEATMLETIKFAKKLNADITIFSILAPYPGTPIRKIIEEEGKLFITDWSEFDNLTGKAIFEHGQLKKEVMESMYKRAYSEFYFRPKYILGQIFRKRNFLEIKNKFNGLLALLEM